MSCGGGPGGVCGACFSAALGVGGGGPVGVRGAQDGGGPGGVRGAACATRTTAPTRTSGPTRTTGPIGGSRKNRGIMGDVIDALASASGGVAGEVGCGVHGALIAIGVSGDLAQGCDVDEEAAAVVPSVRGGLGLGEFKGERTT